MAVFEETIESCVSEIVDYTEILQKAVLSEHGWRGYALNDKYKTRLGQAISVLAQMVALTNIEGDDE